MKEKNNMKKLVIGAVIILLMVMFLCFITGPEPNPTPTPTYTKLPTSTLVSPSPTNKPTNTPTRTPTKTLTPTKTPTPTIVPTEFILRVHTGYEDGWLHFRPGPSKIFLPDWINGIGAFKENTELKFLDCPPVTYPWVHIHYETYTGYVYGRYLDINPCKK